MSYQDDPQGFFRKNNGTGIPNGVNDYTAPVTHDGFLGLGMTADPIAPLEFGDPVRNDVIRLFDGGGTGAHQFYGFGIESGFLRYQCNSVFSGHKFYGALTAAASKPFGILIDRKWIIGDPDAPVGEGHWAIGSEFDNGYLTFNSPNSAAGISKIQGRIYFDGYSGNSSVNGTAIDFQTARSDSPGSGLASRLMITGNGDTMISDPVSSYTVSGIPALALLTVNGAVRVRGGAIVAGNVRQSGGIVFGAGFASGGLELGQETDGGISSIADNNLTFYNNGLISGRVDGGVWSKPGGGLWAATSDIRTKKNVRPFAGGLAKLLELPKSIAYNYNGKGGTIDGPKTYVGFSAQDLQKVRPEWVLEINGESIDSTPVLQVDASQLPHALLEAVRELAGIVAGLRSEIEVLKGAKQPPGLDLKGAIDSLKKP
jgi:hypothetical protein